MMTRLINWLLPQWAMNPLLEYKWLHPRVDDSRRGFVMQMLALALSLAGAALIYASMTGLAGDSQSVTRLVWQSLYFPTLALQGLTSIGALLLGAAVFDAQSQGNTWDNLRVTEIGAGLALRARWMSILYRLRASIIAILLLRLILALGILSDLTAFSGNYVKMLSADALISTADLPISLLQIALSLTASVLLPLPMIASFAALGILLGVAVKDRLFAAMVQILLVVSLVVFVSSASYAVAQLLRDNIALPDMAEFLLFLSYSSYGDWGLSLLQLGNLGAVWQRVPFGILSGLGLAGLLLAQALIADGMMWLAERLAERQS